MEWIWNYVSWSVLISCMLVVLHLIRRDNYNSGSSLPPGPRGWPVLGNIFDLGTLPHRSLSTLKQQYGPVVWLKLGSVKTMVVLSSGAAEEFFKNHDLAFIDRTILQTMKSHNYDRSSIAFSSYSIYWRTLRRICSIEIFTNKKIKETVLIRQKCVDDMVLWIEEKIKTGATSSGIVVTQFVFPTLFNFIGNLTLSRDLVDPHSTMATEFYEAMSGFAECVIRPNISDLFPWLKWLDLQGLRKRSDQNLGKAIEIVTQFVQERVEQRQQMKERRSSNTAGKDFLDVLLDFEGIQKDELAKLSYHQVTIFLLEMFFAGTETLSTTVEWVMCELLKNPQALVKIKDELERVVGANKKMEDSDIDNLHYLQAVIKETLRLHPPAPLIIKKAMDDTDFMGYKIPKHTQVFVNAWAIGRDEESWGNDALVFKPERFLGSDIQYKGQHFKFIPFGAGRRICPGLPLAHRLVPLILGSLLHHFDWELCNNASGNTILDMTETMGVTAKKLHPLKAIPRRSAHHLMT